MRKFKNLEGMKFERLIVLALSERKSGYIYWICQCTCGNQTIVESSNLTSGRTQSCGCLNQEKRTKIFIGQKYNRLTVVKRRKDLENFISQHFYECLCDCGNTTIVQGGKLINGKTQSCGCLQLEIVTTHGLSKTKEYLSFHTRKNKELRKQLDSQWTIGMDVCLREFQPFCVICNTTENLSIDHVLPLSKGYGLVPGNAVILCKSCNSKKRNKILNDLPIETQSKLINAAQ